MRVTLIADISGTRDGAPWPARGESVDLPADEAATLLRANLATADAAPTAKTPAPAEVADEVPAGETATAVPAKPARRTRKATA